MDMYKVKWTQLQAEIFRLLCIKAGEKLSQREIARLLRVSPTAVANALGGLEGFATIQKQKSVNLNFVTLNRDNSKAVEIKRVENLRIIYECGIVDYVEGVFAGATIILFGSYSKGEDMKDSDIDIAVIGRKEKSINLDIFERMVERKINLNFYDALKDVHKDLKENICNGIVLVGGIQI